MTLLDRPRPSMDLYEKPFWEYVQKRELHLQLCSNCSHLRYPPGPVCPRCQSNAFRWKPVSGQGQVISWTVFHRQYLPQLPVPYIVASVALEEGPLLIANINVSPDRMYLGLPVRLVFEEAEGKEGRWQIYQWAPAVEGDDT